MGKVIHPSMGILSPAADISLSDNGVVFASVEKVAVTVSSMSEIEDPESSIISTSLLFNIPRVTAALGWTAAVTIPADLVLGMPLPPLGHPLVVSLMTVSSDVSRLPTQITPSY